MPQWTEKELQREVEKYLEPWNGGTLNQCQVDHISEMLGSWAYSLIVRSDPVTSQAEADALGAPDSWDADRDP